MNAPDDRGGRRLKRPPPPAAEARYTQVNILFPAGGMELPAVEKFNAFPPEAQATILAAVKAEQVHRHAWLDRQQSHEHALNVQSQQHYFVWRLSGLIAGALMTMGTLGMGVWLVSRGAPAAGVALIIAATAALIGTAVYGHQAQAAGKPTPTPKDHVQNG